jgi:RNA polymerase sigma-70 factor (ECF subfamily)
MIHTGLQNDLIEACKKGDPGAQLQVYKSYYKQMFNISYDLVGNSCEADAIVRESFMLTFGKTGAFKEPADFFSRLKWLVEDRSVETWRRNNVPLPGLVTDRVLVK